MIKNGIENREVFFETRRLGIAQVVGQDADSSFLMQGAQGAQNLIQDFISLRFLLLNCNGCAILSGLWPYLGKGRLKSQAL